MNKKKRLEYLEMER